MMAKKKYQIPQHLLIEQMRVHAQRRARAIVLYGRRPPKSDLRDLKASTKDGPSYRVLAKAGKRAGFRISAIRKFAGRMPADRNATIRHFAAAQTEN